VLLLKVALWSHHEPIDGRAGRSLGLYRRFAAHFLTIAFVLYCLTAVIVTILVQTAGAAGYFVASVVEFAATFLVQAAMIKAAQEAHAGVAPTASPRGGFSEPPPAQA
jgi:hypothetical protein